MKTAIVQHMIRWNELGWNLQHLSTLLDQQPGADLYVLAETFATGFLAEGSTGQAEEQSRQIFSWMQHQAYRLDAATTGSVATVDDQGLLRNRLFFVRPDGGFDYYDKHHLFGFAGETDEFVAGERRVVVAWRGVRFLLQVCYDLRFPVFSRNRGDYDAVIYVANWPQSRQSAWQILMRARAIENQCFVVAVNRVGDDAFCHYVGNSAVIDARGNTLVRGRYDEECAVGCELQKETLTTMRQRFRVLDDRDLF